MSKINLCTVVRVNLVDLPYQIEWIRKRDVLPKTINIGAKYMIVESNSDNIITAVADEYLTEDTSLASELVRFLTFSSGRTFEYEI